MDDEGGLPVLPAPSVAVQSRWCHRGRTGRRTRRAQVASIGPSNRVRADGVSNVTVAPAAESLRRSRQSGCTKAGAVPSWTLTWNEVEAGLAEPSVAVQVTVVAPSGKVLPEVDAHVTLTLPATTSLAVGAVKLCVAPEAEVASRVTLSGVPLRTGSGRVDHRHDSGVGRGEVAAVLGRARDGGRAERKEGAEGRGARHGGCGGVLGVARAADVGEGEGAAAEGVALQGHIVAH